MEEEILKGNFKIKNPVKLLKEEKKSKLNEYRDRALASIGGSMVYIERTQHTWDGEEENHE